jgi:arylsulfatase A-like enzyme
MITRTHLLSRILLLAAWFGLVTGLVEGTGLLLFQRYGLLVSVEIIWVAAIFDLLLFGAVGLAITLFRQFLPGLPPVRLSLFLFAFLAFFDWLALSGRIRDLGMFPLAAGLAVAFTRWFRKHEATALQFWHRTLPWVAALAVLALVGIQGGGWLRERTAIAKLRTAPAGSPNILVIVVDTLRADHLSTHGYRRPTSPNLERIAQQGVLFENAFATSSWTLPSHVSLLTGRYPHEHGGETGRYEGRYPIIAEVLRNRGYRTGAFSANMFFFCRPMGFGPGFIHFEDFFHSVADMVARTLYGRKFNQVVLQPLGFEDIPARKLAVDVNRALLRWIDRDAGKPFFAFLNYFDTHDPYLPPQPYRSRFSRLRNPGGILNSFVLRDNPHMTPEQLQGEIDAYDGAIAYTDYQIGQLMEELGKRGLDGNTLVVITSDHGESLGEHGLFLHRNALYQELIRVPLIFWWPGRVPAGVRVEQPVTNAALPATLTELLGMAEQGTFPGPALAQLWRTPATRSDWPYPLAELAQWPFELAKQNPSYYGWMKSLVSSQWQYVVHEKFGEELYDLAKDPGELNNLARTPEGHAINQDFAIRLRKQLEQRQ